jgi:hypothetical protein
VLAQLWEYLRLKRSNREVQCSSIGIWLQDAIFDTDNPSAQLLARPRPAHGPQRVADGFGFHLASAHWEGPEVGSTPTLNKLEVGPFRSQAFKWTLHRSSHANPNWNHLHGQTKPLFLPTGNMPLMTLKTAQKFAVNEECQT